MVLVMESDGSLTPSRSQDSFARHYQDGFAVGPGTRGLTILGPAYPAGEPDTDPSVGTERAPARPSPEVLAAIDGLKPLGAWTLHGRLDRIDRAADGQALVIDYKTEGRTRTADRIKNAHEDTQLAFYAALLSDDTLRAAYLNVGERDGTKLYEQPDVTVLRDRLIDSIRHDLTRIADGAPLPALGEGSACDWCSARGLCRRDSWASGSTSTGALL